MTPTSSSQRRPTGDARVIEFRRRNDTGRAGAPVIAWATKGELVEHAAYRELPTGRTGWFLGEAAVPALASVEMGESVLVFRSRDDGALFTYSQYDAARGVTFEELR